MKNDKRIINGWAIFDWANSAYALVITTAIFPAYFLSVTDDIVKIGNFEVTDSTLYAYCISLAYIIIACFSPLLSGMADYGGKRKFFLRFFTTLGAISCLSLAFFADMHTLPIGIIGFILAMIGWAGSLVFYNAYLPEIVTPDRYDRVSAQGFAFGYVGSMILLIINLIVIMNHEAIGISKQFATQSAFVMVGIWWLGFSQITFNRLPDNDNMPTENLLNKGMEELKKVWRAVQKQENTKTFLFAFFCYSAGVQTALFLATTFAEKELHFETAELIIIILLLQLLAIGGAYFFAKISDWKGNKLSIISMLIIWIIACVMAYSVQSKSLFYVVAAIVGFVMGGIQSLSRSTYSKLIPEGTKDTTSYFSFYDVLEKVAIVIGTFSFGFIEQLTGGIRNSILSLSVFFILGLIIMTKINIKSWKQPQSQQPQS